MTYNEIIMETLKLMNVTYDSDITLERWDDLKYDPNYGGYIAGMVGSYNRCCSDIENKRVIPTKSKEIEPNSLLASGQIVRYDITQLPDFLELERVARQGTCRYSSEIEFEFEGNNLILPKPCGGEKYILVYRPKMERVTTSLDKDKIVDAPDYIATYIPYFLKGDLYREDEPGEANQAMNFYEQGMMGVLNTQAKRQTKVFSRFNIAEM